MQEEVTFESDGLQLAGTLQIPDDYKSGEERSAFLVLHGFGGSKDGGGMIEQARYLESWGYVVLRFDYRGCGQSEGEPAMIRCLDQVADTKNALSWLAKRPEVAGDRIATIGYSFGAAVSIYTAGVDKRVAGAVSIGGWGDGERKFRGQHPTPEAWARFTDMLDRGREARAKGDEIMVDRWDIVPIPEHLRKNLTGKFHMEFDFFKVDVQMMESVIDF